MYFSITKRSKRRLFVIEQAMKIKNVRLKSIEARRYADLEGKPQPIRIDHNSNISQMNSKTAKEATVEFQYTASYGPVGMIKIEGIMLYEDDGAKKVTEQWVSTRKMPDQVASQIHTAVMRACVPQAVGIAKDLGLPPPIPLPQVRLGQKPKKGESGPEVA